MVAFGEKVLHLKSEIEWSGFPDERYFVMIIKFLLLCINGTLLKLFLIRRKESSSSFLTKLGN